MKQLIIALLLIPGFAFGHGDEQHSEQPAKSVASDYFSAENYSDKYEVLIKYGEIIPGEETLLRLFLSVYNTNQPVDSASLTIVSADNQLKFDAERVGNGIYEIKAKFPEMKPYDLNIQINSDQGADLIQVREIEVGKKLPTTNQVSEHESFIKSKGIWILAGLVGGIIMALIIKRKGKVNHAAMLLFAILLLPANMKIVEAHEDHVEASTSQINFAPGFSVLKETQFLFGIKTQKIVSGNFQESAKLSGTVIPSPDGRSDIQSPQSGVLQSLPVTVGQAVKKGTLLAIINQNIDAASTIDLLTQKNALDAELTAAKKDFDRLSGISDIVSKKDLEAAEARYQTALENKKVMDNLLATDKGNSKLIFINAPIDGVVDYFNLSSGATINANETIFSIISTNTVYIEAQSYADANDQITSATKFIVSSNKNSQDEIDIAYVGSPLILSANQSQKLLFKVDNKDQTFKIGEFVSVRAYTDEKGSQLQLPNSCITEINGKEAVFIKDNAEHYSVSYITSGKSNGNYTIVTKGVEEGERVVTQGVYQMKMIFINQ